MNTAEQDKLKKALVRISQSLDMQPSDSASLTVRYARGEMNLKWTLIGHPTRPEDVAGSIAYEMSTHQRDGE